MYSCPRLPLRVISGGASGSRLHRVPQALLPSAKKYAYDEKRYEQNARNEAGKAEETGLRRNVHQRSLVNLHRENL